MQSLPCLDKVIWFSRRALIDIQFAERYTELSHIIVQGPSFGKKGRLRAFNERHFRGSKPLQIFTKLRPIIVYIYTIGLYRDVWIAAIASSTTSLATRTAAICVRFQGRRVRRVYVTMHITFLTRKSALIYRSTSESRQPHSQLQWRFRDNSL